MSQSEGKNVLHFQTKQDANSYLSKLKSAIPKTTSTYKASGKTSITALPIMAIGAALGATLGMTAGVISAALGFFIFTLAILFLTFLTSLQVLFYIIAIIVGLATIFIVFATYFITYTLIGITCGTFVNYIGRLTKNRSTAISIIFSILSAMVAVPLMFWAIQIIAFKYMSPNFLNDTLIMFGDGIPGEQWSIWAWINFGIGTCIAFYASFIGGREEHKFCETCGEFMKVTALDTATTDSLADTLQELSTEAPIASIRQSNIGQNGSLYHCAHCHQGFLDMSVDFQAAFPADRKGQFEKLEESWLAFSSALNPEQTQMLHQKIEAIG